MPCRQLCSNSFRCITELTRFFQSTLARRRRAKINAIEVVHLLFFNLESWMANTYQQPLEKQQTFQNDLKTDQAMRIFVHWVDFSLDFQRPSYVRMPQQTHSRSIRRIMICNILPFYLGIEHNHDQYFISMHTHLHAYRHGAHKK